MTEHPASLEAEGQPVPDPLAFEQMLALHRRALKAHCYRMMGSLDDADDLVQDTLLRAWRARASFDGQGSGRRWLYAIATNRCLTVLKSRSTKRRVLKQVNRPPSQGPATSGVSAETAWLEPYPEAEFPDFAEREPGAEARFELREAVQLAFVAAIQFLPPRQRAALLLCDVLGWSAVETARLLETSTASANSLLQRARGTLANRYPTGRPALPPQQSAEENRLLARYMQAWQDGDLDAFTALLKHDATYTMPPWGDWYQGRPAIRAFLETVWPKYTGYLAVPIQANARLAIGLYARTAGQTEWAAHSLHLIEPDGDAIDALTIYVAPLGPRLFRHFGLLLVAEKRFPS